jgi:ABC-type multidrug transport system ATPase subunit
MSQNIIEVTNVRKEFTKLRKKTVILEDVSFSVKKGDIFGFL